MMQAVNMLGMMILIVSTIGAVDAQEAARVILVSDNDADYAVAQAVENVKGTQVITTPWGTFNQSIIDLIKGKNPKEVLIIGGPAAVPSSYETGLLNFTTTIRIAGKDRFATAAKVLDYFRSDFKNKGAVAAYGYDKAAIKNALETAKSQGGIVIFVNSDTAPWEVQKALENANISVLQVEESPNMNVTEIEHDVKDDVGETRVKSIDKGARALHEIDEAREEILKAEEKLAKANLTDQATLQLLENAKEHLSKAEGAYSQSKYGEAFGQAIAAEHLAENAKDIAEELAEYREEGMEELKELQEKVSEKIEDLREDIIEQEKKVLKAQNKGINASDAKDYLEQATLMLEEAKSTLKQGSTSTAVAKLREAKNLLALAKVSLERGEEALEKGEEKEVEIEVEIEKGTAKVEVEINDQKSKFVLNTANKDEIIAEISKRTGLSIADIEKNIEFEGNHAELGEQKIEKKEKEHEEEEEKETKEGKRD